MRHFRDSVMGRAMMMALLVVTLAPLSVQGEQPGEASAEDAKARQVILNSSRWREAERQFDAWLSVQRIYSKAHVKSLKNEMHADIAKMSLPQLKSFLEEMEAKLRVLMSPASEEARQWASYYSDKYLEGVAKKYGVEDPVEMSPAELEQALQKFTADRHSTAAATAAFDQVRKSEVKAATRFNQAEAKAAARPPQKAATFGATPKSYAPRRNQNRVQTYPKSNYWVGPWGRGWR